MFNNIFIIFEKFQQVTEECNQLRKNLTLMTIESESRKAEIATLNSQINILENTIRVTITLTLYKSN